MTHRIYVAGGTAEQADRWIASQNDTVKPHVEFVNLTRVEQLLGLARPSVITVGSFEEREDFAEWKRAFETKGAQWAHHPF